MIPKWRMSTRLGITSTCGQIRERSHGKNPARLKSANIPISHLVPVPATLEDVFIHLIETEGEEYEQPNPSA